MSEKIAQIILRIDGGDIEPGEGDGGGGGVGKLG